MSDGVFRLSWWAEPDGPPGLLLSAAEASKWLGVHPNTLKRIPPAELPFFRVGSRGDRRYRAADMSAYIERRTAR